MEENIKPLSDIPAINRFLSYCRIRTVPSKTVVIHAGDLPDVLYYIISGSVEVMIEDEEGNEMVLAYLNRGQFFGEMGLFYEQPTRSAWVRTRNPAHLGLTMFFGRLFLIIFVLGTVTGIVQEFQFGMNWSEYSRFVGDVFGAPLAFEGLLAFFLESTFIGLWVFGWNRLKPRIHLATIWIVAIGTSLSAYFILAANAWMQHPVGYEMVNGRARTVSDHRGRHNLVNWLNSQQP